jgi:hypothetical protein
MRTDGYQSAEVFQTYQYFFQGREDYLAVQGEDNYYPIKSSLNEDLLFGHTNGLQTLGMYVLNTNNSCHFICIDIDIPKEKLSEVEFKSPTLKFEFLKDELIRIKNVLTGDLGLNEQSVLCEDSGGRGFHLWIFFETPYDASKALRFCNFLKRKYKLTCEIFPKQSKLSEKRKFGNLIKLPLGVHQKYEARSRFFTIENGEPKYIESVDDNIKHLRTITKIDANDLGVFSEESPAFCVDDDGVEESPISEPRPMYQKDLPRLFNGCAALNSLKLKAEEGHELSHLEAFHLANALLSIENSKSDLLGLLEQSYKVSYSFDIASNEINNIALFKPSSCLKLYRAGICKKYCQDGLEERNEDPLLKKTTPLSLWLEPKSLSATETTSLNLLEQISSPENIKLAYARLKEYQKMQEGVFFDVFDFELFEMNFDENLQLVSIALANRIPIPRIKYEILKIPKKLNEEGALEYRNMAYSSVFDQIAVQATINIIGHILEQTFQDCSYGYRLNVKLPKTIEIFEDWKEKYPQFRSSILNRLREPKIKFYVCCDIKGYYDNIRKDILVAKLRRLIDDQFVFDILKNAIDSYSFEGEASVGLPQGPAYARPMANLYLNEFDQKAKEKCSYYFRYVDDFFMLFETHEEAMEALEWVTKQLSNLHLELADRGDKEAKITESSDESVIKDKIDDLQYAIFEEVVALPFLSAEKAKMFFQKISSANVPYADVNDLNKVLYSYIYIYSQSVIEDKNSLIQLTEIIEELVSKGVFFPKKFTRLFARIIDLLIRGKRDIIEFFSNLKDPLKVHFLLKFYDKFREDPTLRATLANLLKRSLETDDKFLLGFSISIITKHEFSDIVVENDNLIAKIVTSDYDFLSIKYFTYIDYFKLDTTKKNSLLTYFKPATYHVIKRAFFEGLQSFQAFVEIDAHLFQTILSSNTFLLQANVCKALSHLVVKNSLFGEFDRYISSQPPIYKVFFIDFLGRLIFEKYKDASVFDLESLKILFETGIDKEIADRVFDIIARIKNEFPNSTPSPTENYNKIDSYNECLYYKSLVTIDQYLEVIPYYKFDFTSYDGFEKFSRSVQTLSTLKIIGQSNVDYKSFSKSVLITSKLPKEFISLTSYRFNWELDDDCHSALILLKNVFLKAHKYFEIFRKYPLISADNIRVLTDNYDIIFLKIGLQFEERYFYRGANFDNGRKEAISHNCAFLLADLFFKDKTAQDKFKKSSKSGIALFFNYILNRLREQEFSPDRLNYIISSIEKIGRSSNSEITFFYYSEVLRGELFKYTSQNPNWKTITTALKRFYGAFKNSSQELHLQEVKYFDKTSLSSNVPFGLYSLSISLMNLNENLDNLLPAFMTRPQIQVLRVLNLYSAFCVELIGLFKIVLALKKRIEFLDDGPNILIYENRQLQLTANDTEIINKLLKIYSSKENSLFDDTVSFNLHEVAIICVLSYANVELIGNRINLSPPDSVTPRKFDSFLQFFLIKIPDIEFQVTSVVTRINFALSRNFDFPIDFGVDLKGIEKLIQPRFRELIVIRRYYSCKRFRGVKFRINAFGRTVSITRRFKEPLFVSTQSLRGYPLTTISPSQPSTISYDRIGRKVINSVIPNEQYSSLIQELRSRRSLKTFYSGKFQLLVDFLLLALFFWFSGYLTFLYDHKPTDPSILNDFVYRFLHSGLWPSRQVLNLPLGFFAIKVFLWDLPLWIRPYKSLMELFKIKKL